jgi:hypothetical protein
MVVHGLCNTSALYEQKKTKLWNKQHIVENKTEILQHDLKMQQIYLLPKDVKWISWGVVMCVRVWEHKLFKWFCALYEQVLLQTADLLYNSEGLCLKNC